MSDLLRSVDLHVAYGDQQVLRGVSLSITPGEIVAIIGPNGCGKTTLIKTLLGHVRSRGTIQWDGKDLLRWNRRDLAKRLAYLPQIPTHEQGQTVLDVLKLGRAPYWAAFGVESLKDGEVVTAIATELGLNDLLNRSMDELSGGQRQRIFIGRCLVQEPAMLMLDEPDTYLDLRYQVELARTLKSLVTEKQIGVLLASHDLNGAAALANRLVLMSEGMIVAEGPPNDVLSNRLLSEVYGVELEFIQCADGTPTILPKW